MNFGRYNVFFFNIIFNPGTYLNGFPSGPGWIFPYDYEKEGVVYVFFDSKGELNRDNVVWIRPGLESAVQGALVNGSLLANPREATLVRLGDYRCGKVLDLKYKDNEVKNPGHVRLPVKLTMIPAIGRIVVRSAKTLIFNRIAKTGE